MKLRKIVQCLLISLTLTLGLTACGVPGPPLPPLVAPDPLPTPDTKAPAIVASPSPVPQPSPLAPRRKR